MLVLALVLCGITGCCTSKKPSKATDGGGQVNSLATNSEANSDSRDSASVPNKKDEIPLSVLVAKLNQMGVGPTRDQTYSIEEVKKRMASLKKGMTKEEVLRVVGVPKAPMSKDSWVYIQDRGPFLDGSAPSEALAIEFKDDKVLKFRLKQGVTFGIGGGGL